MTHLFCTNITYSSYLKELQIILMQSGIANSRSPVLSQNGSRKNQLEESEQLAGDKVGRVILYMEKHLTDDLNLGALAEDVNLSKYQLIRRFRKEAGFTPWRFLILKRIEKVKDLLINGIAPAQAAVEAGFFDQSHLNKVFRKETGFTPKEYQEKYFVNRN